MSADTTPIAPARFAAALKDLSIEMLHLKVLEIRNSMAHLQYSNDQLKPFAESPDDPDPDCAEAIRENEKVIDRMAERVALVRIEVEDRGVSWAEFQSKDEVEAAAATTAAAETNGHTATERDGETGRPSPWTDGTFQTGTIRNGEVRFDDQPAAPRRGGGTMSDEELRRALEERMRGDLGADRDGDDGDEAGMHL